MDNGRDVALVLSGGAVNGILMELGFLQRVRASALWPRVGWIFGTSAGALAGTLASLDRLDDLERFLLDLRPEEAFRPHRLWRLPLLGSHDYTLPHTIERHFGELRELAAEITHADRELVVTATDVTDRTDADWQGSAELVYSSRTTPPDELAQAILASAAISTLVLPLRVGDRLATDGGWTRNFPLGHAYERPEVRAIVAFRYLPKYPPADADGVSRLRRRLRPFAGVPPVRALIAELREAEERDRRGEPPHLVDMIRRLMRIAVAQNMRVEERSVRDAEATQRELARLRSEVRTLVEREAGPTVADAVEERFAAARFPFGRERATPTIVVRAAPGDVSLETGSRTPAPWTRDAKRALIRRGYELTDRELRAHGVGEVASVVAAAH